MSGEKNKDSSINYPKLAICALAGFILWWVPPPVGLDLGGWRVFSVFFATILGFILRPIPMGPTVLLALVILAITNNFGPPIEKELLLSEEQKNEYKILNNENAKAVSFAEKLPQKDEASRLAELKEQHHEKLRAILTKEQYVKYKKLSKRSKVSFSNALSGYGNTTVWLVVGAFLIAGAMIRTGLGKRIALGCVVKFGKTTLGLGYATAFAEFILGPAIPSNTARGGGVMAPIVNSLSRTLGSSPEDQPKRAGEYLMLNGAHLNLITAAMFLTGMAANGLVSAAASDNGLEFGWVTWVKGSIVPGLASLLLLPWFLFKLVKPELKDARAAQSKAKEQLSEMGAWTRGEKTMLGVFVMLLVLWTTSQIHGMQTGAVALVGVLALLLTGVEKWEDVTGNKGAWDTMVWLGGMVSMASALKDQGFIAWFAGAMEGKVSNMGVLATALILAVVYFYSMYSFSMLTGHITAMVAAFLALALAVEVPGMLMVALLAYFSNLCGCLTNYSTGPVVIYSGFGYVPVARWFKIGFIVSLFHLVVWLGVGLPYWKLLGWW